MSMFNFCPPGVAYLHSDLDPRWNHDEHCDAVGGFVMPEELKPKLEELKKKYGDPPKDLEWGYMKD